MHVIFVEPSFPANQKQFVRGLAELGATVTGIGERASQALDPEVRDWLTHYEQVGSVVDEDQLSRAVGLVNDRLKVDRLEAVVEAHVLAAARVREKFSIRGSSVRTTYLCRDKPAMKQALREEGIACAQSMGSDDREEIRAFADTVGFPLVIKPPDAAGASGTYRADDMDGLETILDRLPLGTGATLAVEEFIEGHEAFYDTLTLDGHVVHDFISHYYPNVLEAMRTRWISPQFITTNRIDDAPEYEQVREMGRRVISILGIETSATHMEWFFGPKGLKFSEIACRPPGVGAWDLYSAANDIDLYREWASVIVRNSPSQTPSRAYSAGIINLRPERDGDIVRYEGLDAIREQYGAHILDFRLPEPGTPTQPVEQGYMANAWLRMRHPDYDRLRAMLNSVGETVRVLAE